MIDVIVPVYRGLEATMRCLASVMRHPQRQAFELVVVDDATPQPAIAAYLDGLAGDGRITLLRNEANAGFVRSVNRGMALHGDRDVVLLNSDTEVANDWLDRLHAAAHAAPDVASATPFSNNATICSYPFEGWKGGVPGTQSLEALDAMVAKANAGRVQDIPTAVGFCMYIRRDALDAVGLFDAERYGRGYGEENDFCMRAAKAGRRHVLAADTYVFHEGSVSFSDERFELMRASAKALVEAHPEYPRLVHDFIRADPVAPLRAAIDNARVALGAEEARLVLMEREEERNRLVGDLFQIDRLAAERDERIGQLSYAIDHATTHIADRDRIIAERDALIAELRKGLAHAESLAFSRQAELAQIRRSRVWRAYEIVRRKVRWPA